MKIGILTIHTAFNYGAMLQAYALQAALIKLGFEVQIIDYYSNELERNNLMLEVGKSPKQIISYLYAKFNPAIQKRISRFNSFRGSLQLTKRYRDKEELYKTPPEFDIYIIGSDQVWNLERGFDPFWFLDFVKSKPKVSYASSFGTATISQIYHEKLNFYLSEFSTISVRETDGVKIIEEATGLSSIQVLDPTFLLSSEEWTKLAAKKQVEGEYILAYGFSKSEKFASLLSNIKKIYNLPVVAIPAGIRYPYKVDKIISNAGPEEFIALFRDAKVICTDSFHGLAFSIHFRKPFFTIPHPSRNSRLENLLALFNIKNRQINNPETLQGWSPEELTIRYEEIENLIQANTNKSIMYLKKLNEIA